MESLDAVWLWVWGWLSAIKDLNAGAQAATIGLFVVALLTAVLVAFDKFFTVLGLLWSGVSWLWRRLSGAGKRRTVINLPDGRGVVGRTADVRKLRRTLRKTHKGDGADAKIGAVLRGQGGLGKSTLARRYAEVHGGDYDGVIWVEALTRQGIIEGLARLRSLFGLERVTSPQHADAQEVIDAVAASGQSWLFLYDNVEAYADLKGLLPPKGAHLIVTTRQGEGWPGFAVMPLETLDFETESSPAVTLLMDEAGRTEGAAEARALAEDLGGLPLALVVAGRLIQSTGEGFAAYRARLSDILAHAPLNEDYPTSVLGAVQLSYDQLSDDARMVADLCAWWAAEGLEPALLTEAPQAANWNAALKDLPDGIRALAAEPGRVRAGFAALTSRSLMESSGGSWSMHRMTAAALRHLQAERGDADTARAAAALLAAVYPGGVERNVNNSKEWPLCARLTPHVRALWASGTVPETEAMDFLLNQTALYLDKIADFPGGLEMARAALALTEKRLPEDHREIAIGFANLGLALLRAGDLTQAEARLARAVELDETHRPDSLDLAEHYDLHGFVLFAQARAGDAAALARSLRLHQQALALYRRLAGRDSEATARALNNLALVREFQGRTAAAARLSAAALAIRRRVLEPGDANLGYSLMNTGSYWLRTGGGAAKAEPLLREALELRQTVFAAQPQHPDTRLAANWLIDCLLTLARAGDRPVVLRAEARALCDRYGYDFAEQEKVARQYPLQPAEA